MTDPNPTDTPPPAKEPIPTPAVAPASSSMRSTTAESKGHRVRQLWLGMLWYPLVIVDAIDLKTGLPDHDRIVSLGVGTLLAVMVVRAGPGNYPPTVLVVACIAAMFGPRMFTKFLVRSKLGATDQTINQHVTQDITIRQEITERRAQGDGTFEPTP